jgi:hypothetical protein
VSLWTISSCRRDAHLGERDQLREYDWLWGGGPRPHELQKGERVMNALDGHIQGLHHVTVGVDGAQDDVAFVRDLLGLRVIKATVLFDGERLAYHLYYGDRDGYAGSVFTTSP